MNAAKMTLTATVLAAAFGLVLGLSAVPSDSYACHHGLEHGKETDCGAGGGFTAELTGAFVFRPVSPVVVTPNSRENVLASNTGLDMVRPTILDPPGTVLEDMTWDQVFNTCGELLDPDSVDGFLVGDDNWRINNNSG